MASEASISAKKINNLKILKNQDKFYGYFNKQNPLLRQLTDRALPDFS
jgi:hypothetical protein